MKIKITDTIKLAINCRRTETFIEDQELDIEPRIANRLIELGSAVILEDEEKKEQKAFKEKLENKAILKTEENKKAEKETKKSTKKKTNK